MPHHRSPIEQSSRRAGVRARPRTQEALDLVTRLLRDDPVRFQGRFYSADNVSLVPKPLQRPIPTYVATSTPQTIRWAAQRGYGIMAGPPFPLHHIAAMTRHYRETEGARDPGLVLIRFYHVAKTRAVAIAEARPRTSRSRSAGWRRTLRRGRWS